MTMKLRNDNIDINDSSFKIALKFDITMLNNIIGYIYKDTNVIGRRQLQNVKRLFDIIDTKIYETKPNLYARIKFINRTMRGKLEKGYENESILVNYCRESADDKDTNTIINNLEKYKKINFEEINFISKAISDRLRFAFLLIVRDNMYNVLERLESGEFESYEDINEDMLYWCKNVINQNRKLSQINETTTFSLTDENFDENVGDMIDRLKNPASTIYTGIQKLNQILAPGYMAKRVYCYMGLPAGFKSGILLKSLRDAKKYNKELLSKNRKPGKRATMLMVTMENTVEETVERLFNMTVYPDDIRKFDTAEAIDLLKQKGEMTVDDDDDIDIVIKYYPNRSISTADLYTIISELDDEGRDVRMLVLDYIKRIRPAERAKDEKEELKHITNELKTLAIEYEIPVVTAHQLNRNAAATVDAAMTSDKEDLARFVGRSNVGTAWEIVENIDWGCVINVEKKKDTDQYYLTFKRIKIRYRDPNDLGYFNHPFNKNNRMELIDDIHLDNPLSEESLANTFEGTDLSKKGRKHAKNRLVNENDDDLFDFGRK